MKTLIRNSVTAIALACGLFVALGCQSSVKDLIELELDPPSRRSIDRSRVGVNNFFVDPEFGSIAEQFLEIRDVLGLRFVRILFAWTDDVQATPTTTPDYSFYDAIISAIPPGVDVLVVLVHSPSWMADSANYIDGDPRLTWVERWLKPTVTRYAGNPQIVGWEVWNEPDLTLFNSDAQLGLEEASQYISLLTMGSAAIRAIDPTSLVLNAATQSIQQSFDSRLAYNVRMRDLGALSLIDVWNIHYYGEQFENLVRSGGVSDFLSGLPIEIWLTESGETGPNNQLPYAETTWPFLREQISNLDRIYYYQFGETGPVDSNFGLRTTDPSMPISDLYVHLRDG